MHRRNTGRHRRVLRAALEGSYDPATETLTWDGLEYERFGCPDGDCGGF